MAKKPTKQNERHLNIDRNVALHAAVLVNAGNPTTAEQIVKDAETYFQFLTK